MKTSLTIIEDTNISRAWARAFLAAAAPGQGELLPLHVTVTNLDGGWPAEIAAVRQALDHALTEQHKKQCETVSNTIFPQSLWNPDRDRHELFDRYLRILPSIQSGEGCNKYGLYFERLIAFGPNKVNQLDHIIETYHRGNHRRSALQAGIFDPCRDHTHQRQRGFPCLQQVSFVPSSAGGLTVNAFYATQLLFEKAYGNYMGLYNLGYFIAHELGLRLTGMTCVAGVAKLSEVSLSSLRPLTRELQDIVGDLVVIDPCELTADRRA